MSKRKTPLKTQQRKAGFGYVLAEKKETMRFQTGQGWIDVRITADGNGIEVQGQHPMMLKLHVSNHLRIENREDWYKP